MISDDEIDERLVNSGIIDNIESSDISLRPKRISEFIGQPQVQQNLSTFIAAAGSVSYTHLTLPTRSYV